MIARAGVSAGLRLGDATEDEAAARRWLGRKGLDGIVAKRLDLGYLPGERAMQKFKVGTTVDCVVAGLYRKGGTQAVQHLLLGLYDEEGKLNCRPAYENLRNAAEIGRLLEPLVGGGGGSGDQPSPEILTRSIRPDGRRSNLPGAWSDHRDLAG